MLKLRAPTKIFGDLHGQFGDLMRLFAEYGSPSTVGDIAYIDYPSSAITSTEARSRWRPCPCCWRSR